MDVDEHDIDQLLYFINTLFLEESLDQVNLPVVLIELRWTRINHRYCIDTDLKIFYHQHQNYAEGIGDYFKLAVINLFHNTPHTPLPYWWFTACFIYNTHRFLSKPSLNGRTGYQITEGETGI